MTQPRLLLKGILPKREKAPAKIYGLADVLLFGRFARQTVQAAIVQDSDYIPYMAKKYKMKFSPEVYNYIEQFNFYSK